MWRGKALPLLYFLLPGPPDAGWRPARGWFGVSNELLFVSLLSPLAGQKPEVRVRAAGAEVADGVALPGPDLFQHVSLVSITRAKCCGVYPGTIPGCFGHTLVDTQVPQVPLEYLPEP